MRGQRLVEFGHPLEAFESPTPTPQGVEVLLRVLATGVCHSDLHICDGHYDLGGGKRLELAERGLVPPIVLGHEVVGEVVGVGPEGDPGLLGQRRLVYPWLGCGWCEMCRRGLGNRCDRPGFVGIHRAGGYADHVLVPNDACLVGIGDLQPAEAAPYACSGVTAFSALMRVPPEVREKGPIVIIGAGGLGLMCLTLLRALGGHGAVVVEIDPTKRAEAARLGALAVVDGKAPDVREQVLAAVARGVGAVGGVPGAVGKAPGAVLDFVGSTVSAELGVQLLDRGGQYIIVGLYGGSLVLALPPLALRAIRIEGSNVGTLAELKQLMSLVCAQGVPRIAVQLDALERANEVHLALRAGRVVGRTVLQP
jgi:alcohol dehydrogenase, propanol-preferring